MEEDCKECKITTIVVADNITGDLICTECGLVLEERLVENYFYEDKEANEETCDPYIRERELSNPLITDTKLDLGTSVIKESHSQEPLFSSFSSLYKSDDTINFTRYERNLGSCFEKIEELSERFLSTKNVINQAFELCKSAYERGLATANHSTVAAACVSLSCEIHKVHRSRKEIFSGCDIDVTYKSLNKQHAIIKDQSTESFIQFESIKPKHFVARFCSCLNMSKEFITLAVRAAINSERCDIRRSPISVAAGLIYLLSGMPIHTVNKQLLEDIHVSTGVSSRIILATYKDLIAHEAILFNNEDLQN